MQHIAMVAQPIQRIPPTGAAAVEWWMWQVSKQLARSGRYIPHIICTGENDPAPEYEEREGVHFYRITLSRTYKRLFQKWTRLDPYGYAARAAHYCKKINARIIHTHNSPDLHMNIAKFLINPKTILHMHNEKQPGHNLHADLLLTVSNYMMRWYRDRLKNINIQTITNGIDREQYCQDSTIPEWRLTLPATAKILMFAGRISPEKGVHLLAEAFAHLTPKHPEIQLVIIGGRSKGNNDRAKYSDKLETFLKPFSGRVIFLGSINPAEMHRHYRAADLLVVPSVFEEPFGMVCLEGMAAGIPVLAAPRGGLPEFVHDKKTGYLIKNHGDSLSLAAQIEHLLNAPKETKRVALNGLEYAREKHDWSCISNRLCEIYDDLLACKA